MSEPIDPSAVNQVAELARRAKSAARELVLLTSADKDTALLAMADALDSRVADIVAANADDLTRGREHGMPEGLLDRLLLDERRVRQIADATRQVAALPDPVGAVVRGATLANGLQIRQVRVPMGVIGMIYEARPNVTVDVAALAVKSGNAAILRGGTAAESTNRVLVAVLRGALAAAGLPEDAVGLLDGGGRDAARALMTARGLVDLVIPRGGADLIATVVRESTVPVIETGIGVNHVYVDAGAEPQRALAVVLNSKTQRPSVCNAAESLLVHEAVAEKFLPDVLRALAEAQVVLHVAPEVSQYAEAAGAAYEIATDADYGTEWHRLEMNVRTVATIDEALEHIRVNGTMHTEVIVTEDRAAARRFVAEVDAAVVMVNASSRFTDGGEFGMGAEIGISTQKMHARGPMALPELTTTKWIVDGDGQIRN